MARGGASFTHCYVANPICSPSRASSLTSLLPHSHGMVDATHAVPSYRAELQPGLAMWPQMLQAVGYRTGYFGKWHVERSNRLEQFGFDVYEVEAYHKLLGLVERDDTAEDCVVRQPGYKDFLLYGVSEQPVEETASISFTRRVSTSCVLLPASPLDRGRCFLAAKRPIAPVRRAELFRAL